MPLPLLIHPHPPYGVEDPWYSQIRRELLPSRLPSPRVWEEKPSLLFAAALSHCKVPFDLHVFAGGPHGVGLAVGDPTLSLWT